MGLPRLDHVQAAKNAEGCVEVYFYNRDNGWILKRRELERVLAAKEGSLPGQEFVTILGNSVWVDGKDIALVLDYSAEACQAIWEDALEDARHETISDA
jgi:hypothetical protein